MGDNLHNEVMSTGRPGRLGSTPGFDVGIGFCNKPNSTLNAGFFKSALKL